MTRDESLRDFLAGHVMDWHREDKRLCWRDAQEAIVANPDWNPLESGHATFQLWEQAREAGVGVKLYGTRASWGRTWMAVVNEDPQGTVADSGPRAVSEAIAKAYGWEEPIL